MSTPDASNAALRSSYDTRISWFRAGEADPTASSEAETARTLLHQRPLNSSDRRTEGQIRIRREDGTHPLTTITVQDYSFDVESEKSVEFAALNVRHHWSCYGGSQPPRAGLSRIDAWSPVLPQVA